MSWIKYRPNEPIPEELYYDGWQTDRDFDNRTPLILWIGCRDEDIPKELYYDGC